MSKVLIELYLPAAERVYDVRLPQTLPLREVIPGLAAVLEELAEGCFKATGQEVLCEKATGQVYDQDQTLAELGIQTGTRMILY